VLFYGTNTGRLMLSGDGGDSFVQVWQTPAGASLNGMALDTSVDSMVVASGGESGFEVFGVNPYVDLGGASSGTGGLQPRHFGAGGLPQLGNAGYSLEVVDALAGAVVLVHLGVTDLALPFLGGVLHTGTPTALQSVVIADGAGAASVAIPIPISASLAGLLLFSQAFVVDPGIAAGLALSNGLSLRLMP